MTDIASLSVHLNLDDDRFSERIRNAARETENFGKTAEGNAGSLKKMEVEADSLGQTATRLKSILAGLVGLKFAKDFAVSLVESQRAMQRIEFGLQGALGSARAAGEAYEFVSQKASELGLDLQVAAHEFMKLTAAATAMNVPMKQQQELFDGLSRSATVLHLSSDQVKFATMALSQMFGKGKIQAEELRRQLGEHVPGVVPRFQKAVLAMTEGTELQGMSFDDLLQRGLLYTDKFLPALVDALQQTGRGAELAAQGINANLNRVSSEWFKFQADLTEGFFIDTLNEGVAFLADNMKALASSVLLAVSAFAGLKIAQMAGRMTKDSFGRVQGAVDHRREAADVARAEQVQQRAIQQKTQARLADIKAQQTQAVALRQEIAQKHAAARAEAVAAQAAANSARSRLQLSGTIYHTRKAEEELTQALFRQQVARQRSQELRAQEIALKTTESRLNQQLATSTNALTAAQRAQQRLGFGPTLARGFQSAGRGLLALAGGPWGAVLLGVAGIAAGFVSARHKMAEAERQFRETIVTAKDLTVHLKDVADSANGLNLMSFNPQEMIEAYAQGVQKSQELKDEQASLNAEVVKLEKQIKMAGNAINGAMGRSAGTVEELERKLALARERSEEISTLMNGEVIAGFDQMKAALERTMRPEIFHAMTEAIRQLDSEKLEALRAELNATERAGLDAGMAIASIASSLSEQVEKRQLQFVRLTQGELAAFDMQMAKQREALQSLGKDGHEVTPEDLAIFDAQVTAMRGLITASDHYQKSTRSATKASKEFDQAEASRLNTIKSLRDRMERQLEVNQEFLDTDEKMSATKRLLVRVEQQLNDVRDKSSAAEVAELERLIERLKLQDQDVQQKERLLDLNTRLANLNAQIEAERLSVTQQNEDGLLAFGRSDREAEEARRRIQILRTYQSRIRDLSKQGLDPNDPLYAQQRQVVEQQLQWRLAQEQLYQDRLGAMRQDWTAGMRRGWQNFHDEANNIAEKTASITADALNGLVDKLHQAVTTGKLQFSDLISHILSEISRMLMARAVSQFVDLMLTAFGITGAAKTSGTQMNSSANATAIGYTPYEFANGGIMTSQGSLPLNYYANGGIARSPQLAIYGEGRMPEAYVPLPDGRSIPVTMTSDSSGGGGVVNHTQIGVTINSDGSATADDSASSSQARELGRMIEHGVRTVLATEMRQGGLLWRMQHA